MSRSAPEHDRSDGDLRVSAPATEAAGRGGVQATVSQMAAQVGAVKGARLLLRVNQPGGFDCPGCAWPEPASTHTAEFCENGAKAVAEEATDRRIRRDFFARHSISDLAQRSGWWLGQQGRLTEPMVRRRGSDRYEPISWDDAYDLIVAELLAGEPDDAVFYTSGRTSNEAAFAYQLLVRGLGTNNLPDCSNMCHESSGAALVETLGVGKGSVTVDDLSQADLIFVVGQNPGTNHPRMLSALRDAKRAGARIVAVNPLPEAGLLAFADPQTPGGLGGRATPLADRFVQIRVNGDLALFQAVNHALLAAEAAAPGTVLDRAFIEEHTDGFDAFATAARQIDRDAVLAATGLAWADIDAVVNDVLAARSIIVCWAMGLTQHKNSVPTIREIVSFLLLRGNIGRPGAGVCPVRGHSNVQGDRTMGIYEKPAPAFLDALQARFAFAPPRHDGYDTVDAIRAMRDGKVRTFFAMGGNFVSATPDTDVTEAALARCALTVQVSTKLNRSHVVTGEQALILPTLGRTERDLQGGALQSVTVEDSMGQVHASTGTIEPASPLLRSEVAIVCDLAERLFARRPGPAVPWRVWRHDYRQIRAAIEAVVPGFEDIEARIAVAGGFRLPHAPRDERRFPTSTGRARFVVNDLHVVAVPPGRLLLQTLRSHDQYNTTIYGLDDRYRGITAGRRVVFVHPDDLELLGLADGAMVDLVSEWTDGERRAEGFRCVAYPTARGCAAAYFPETNVLVPLDSTAEVSQTPTSKSIVVRLDHRPA